MPTKIKTTRSANKNKPASKGKGKGKATPKGDAADHQNPWAPAGAELAAIRSAAEMTQVSVATGAGMGQNRISAAEKSTNLNWDTMNKVAAACRSPSAPQGYGFMKTPRHLMKKIEAVAKANGISTAAWLAKQLGVKK